MHYNTNFSPKINKQKCFNKKKIYLKNFFIFTLLLKNSNNIKSTSIFVKPKQRRSMVMLRAPYRYKLARLHLTLNRYNIIITLKVRTKNDFTCIDISKNKKNLDKLGSSFESIFLHQRKFLFKFTVSEKKNFFLKNFNVIFVKNLFI